MILSFDFNYKDGITNISTLETHFKRNISAQYFDFLYIWKKIARENSQL